MGRIFSIDFGSSIVSEELYGSLPNQFIDGVYWTTKRIFETVMFDTWLQTKQVHNFYEMLHRIINLSENPLKLYFNESKRLVRF